MVPRGPHKDVDSICNYYRMTHHHACDRCKVPIDVCVECQHLPLGCLEAFEDGVLPSHVGHHAALHDGKVAQQDQEGQGTIQARCQDGWPPAKVVQHGDAQHRPRQHLESCGQGEDGEAEGDVHHMVQDVLPCGDQAGGRRLQLSGIATDRGLDVRARHAVAQREVAQGDAVVIKGLARATVGEHAELQTRHDSQQKTSSSAECMSIIAACLEGRR